MIITFSPRLNYDFCLRSAYSKNRNARKAENRETLPNRSLVIADSDAVKKISEKLRNLEYSSDNSKEVLQTTKAFVEIYNNLVDSSGKSEETSIATLKKQLSKMTKSEKEELASIGIEIKSNGQLKLDVETFGKSRPAKIEKILSGDCTFAKSVRSFANKIHKLANRQPSAYTPDGSSTSKSAAAGSTVDVSL